MFALRRWYRATRYGQPIVIVSGLPRSGTSMVMRMLHAGGVPIATDGIRRADVSNPHGYFEYERVKELDKGGDASWLRELRGQALKVISFLLRDLPSSNNYDVIFLRREMRDILESQDAMLTALGTADADTARNDERMAAGFREHLAGVERLLATRPGVRVHYLDYADVIRQPLEQARRIAHFLDRPLDTDGMAAAVDPSLQHHRS